MSTVLRTSWFGVVVAGMVAGAIAFSPPVRGAAEQPAPSPEAERAIEMADSLSEAFEYVAKVITPSVVTIQATRQAQRAQAPRVPDSFRGSPFGDEFFERFFGLPFGGPQADPGPRIQQGQGTGFIVSEDGYILTNNHVVDQADEVRVILTDERSYEAEIVGTDPQTDVAVLKIEATGLQPATLGDSDSLSVGQWVVAAGSPLGLSSTITAGIVSATGRSRVGVTDYEDFIQTDAAINPGNSGGPLVNLRGEVVGMNTAIATRTGGNMGIGFAIPVNMAGHVMRSLIDDGEVRRGWLGVVIQDLTPGLAASFGYEGTDGALISEVTAGGPAERAGFQPGDIITRYNGETVEHMDELRLNIAATAPGSSASFTIFRDGETFTTSVEIGSLRDSAAASGAPASGPAPEDLGLRLEDLTAQLAQRLGAPTTLTGVVVTGVQRGSAAHRAGILPRDIITSVQGESVDGAASFRAAMAKHDLKGGVRLTVITSGRKRFVLLRSQR